MSHRRRIALSLRVGICASACYALWLAFHQPVGNDTAFHFSRWWNVLVTFALIQFIVHAYALMKNLDHKIWIQMCIENKKDWRELDFYGFLFGVASFFSFLAGETPSMLASALIDVGLSSLLALLGWRHLVRITHRNGNLVRCAQDEKLWRALLNTTQTLCLPFRFAFRWLSAAEIP